MEVTGLGLRRRLIAAGYTDREIRRGRRAGELVTVRRGAYVAGDDARLTDAAARHSLLVAAALPDAGRGSVVSHASAAVLFGLPTWSVPLRRVHLTRHQRTGGRVGRTVHLHAAPLAPDEIVEVDGIAVTSPARTVVDLARALPFTVAVAVADAALRLGLVDREDIATAVERAAGWRGSPSARRVVAFADGRSANVGESRSRVALHRAGLPAPVTQWDVFDGPALLGRVDFGWPGLRTVGEFDGRVKYGRSLTPARDPGEVVFQEKLREDRLRERDLGVVRWIWAELADFAPVAARIRRAFH